MTPVRRRLALGSISIAILVTAIGVFAVSHPGILLSRIWVLLIAPGSFAAIWANEAPFWVIMVILWVTNVVVWSALVYEGALVTRKLRRRAESP